MINSFVFRSITEQDIPILFKWFNNPHIEKWWPVLRKEEDFIKNFQKKIESPTTKPFLVIKDNEPFGYIQIYKIDPLKDPWLPKLPPNSMGIDQLIGEEKNIGKGYGPQFIKEFMTYYKNLNKEIGSIITDPNPENLSAIKCYKKIGFKSLGQFQAPWGPVVVMILK